MRKVFAAAILMVAVSSANGADSALDMSSCATSASSGCPSAVRTEAQRVRREIRSLSTEEWDKVVAAMWIMKNTALAAGQTQYGSKFKPYDYFVVKHAVATTDSRGDQAHFGPQFMTWHGAFVLEFEEALLAVDPSVGALPYWDASISSPSAFDNTYLGSDPTDATSFQVTTGPFANWPVESSFDIADYATFITDDSTVVYEGPSTGFLRCSDYSGCSTESSNSNVYVTRYGDSSGGRQGFATEEAFYSCTASTYTNWNDWYSCIEHGRPSLHSGPHASIGGSSGDSRGDFEDPVSSPNAPIFMFHHNNMERNKYHWMGNQSATKCDFFDYPATGAVSAPIGGTGVSFDGMNLDEEVSSSWGFTAADLGVDGEDNAPTGQFTHGQVLCWLNPAHAAYTFDTYDASASTDLGDDGDDGYTDSPSIGAASPARGSFGMMLAAAAAAAARV